MPSALLVLSLTPPSQATRPASPCLLPAAAALRHYVELTIRSDKPANARLALQSAAQYGALATALQSAGVKYDGLASTDAGDAAPTSEDGGSSGGGSSTAAIVGGVVGGMAAAALAAATVYLVSWPALRAWPPCGNCVLRQSATTHSAGIFCMGMQQLHVPCALQVKGKTWGVTTPWPLLPALSSRRC